MTLKINQSGDQIVATLAGRLDTAASSQFAADMQPLIDNADKAITLDCSAMEFISSSGLRLLLTLRKATIAQGGSVTITGVNENVKQVFAITGFYSLFNFA